MLGVYQFRCIQIHYKVYRPSDLQLSNMILALVWLGRLITSLIVV